MKPLSSFVQLRVWFTILLFLILPLLFSHRLSLYAAVTINELYPKPSNETGEWIELFNTGPDSVSLEGWRLENTAGDKKTYSFTSGSEIHAGNFLTIFQSQTAISLYNEGDSVRLFDSTNNQVDSQSYPSTLGYNTSVGRTTDPAGSWVVCTNATPNQPNSCPIPTITPTPLPTQPPANTPTPPVEPTQIPPSLPPAQTIAPSIEPVEVLGATSVPNAPITPSAISQAQSYADVIQAEQRWSLGVAILFIGTGLSLLAVIGSVHHWLKHRRSQ